MDISLLVAELLGMPTLKLGAIALTVVAVATVAGILKPKLRQGFGALRARLERGRTWARGTRVLWDDHLMAVATVVVQVVVTVVDAVLWLLAVLMELVLAHLGEAMKAAREAKLLESRR